MLIGDIKIWESDLIEITIDKESKTRTVTYPVGEDVFIEAVTKFFPKEKDIATCTETRYSSYLKGNGVDLLEFSEFYERIKGHREFEVSNIRMKSDFVRTMLQGKTIQPDPNHHFNEKVNVHISDIGIMQMQSVTVIEDACTNDISTQLQDGWRILAVCPQPDQRRPDYILGHKDEHM